MKNKHSPSEHTGFFQSKQNTVKHDIATENRSVYGAEFLSGITTKRTHK